MCLLDNTSGAAISARTFLEVLAQDGMKVESFTASLFDPNRDLILSTYLGPKASNPEALGKRFIIEKSGVTHSVFLTRFSQSSKMKADEQQAFEQSWLRWLANNKPRVVITFGGSPYTIRLQGHARRIGARIVHYLGNAEYKKKAFYQKDDIIICPSNFLKDHYKETLELDAQVVRNIILPERLDLETPKSESALLARKMHGFVTFMNPIPHKGLTLFTELVKAAAKELPTLKFLVTEGRSNREWLARHRCDLTQMQNVWFMCNHEDVRSIYQRTSVLLVPSFWKEGFARSVQEAQLSGIPVISSDRGGLPEALNGGSKSFTPPAKCIENHMAIPDEHSVSEWWNYLKTLMIDDDFYLTSSQKALSAAQVFHPDTTSANAVKFFKAILGQTRLAKDYSPE